MCCPKINFKFIFDIEILVICKKKLPAYSNSIHITCAKLYRDSIGLRGHDDDNV